MAFLLLTLCPQVRFSSVPKIYSDVAEIYQRRLLEAQTHLVLASGKLILQKNDSKAAFLLFCLSKLTFLFQSG